MPVSKNPNVWRNLDEPSSCGYARRCECDCGPHRGIQYEHYQPIFWRVAPSARDNHLGFLAKVLANERTIALVWEEPPGTVEGFIIANIIAAPPVYEPGVPPAWWMIIGYAGWRALEDHRSGSAGRGVFASARQIRSGSSLGRVRTSGHGQTHHVARSRPENCVRMVRERAQVMAVSRNGCRYQ